MKTDTSPNQSHIMSIQPEIRKQTFLLTSHKNSDTIHVFSNFSIPSSSHSNIHHTCAVITYFIKQNTVRIIFHSILNQLITRSH